MHHEPTPLENTEEGRAFLQHRVAIFGLFGAGIGGSFIAFRVIQETSQGHADMLFEPSLLYHTLGAACLFALWLVCRTGQRSPRFLRAADIAALLGACTFYALMGSYIPIFAQPHYIVILALTFGLFARAIYVPSSAKRTVILTALSGVPMLVVTYLMYYDLDVETWTVVIPELQGADAPEFARSLTAFAAAWWACAVVVCGAASHVIYGLRRQVRDVRKLGQYTLVEKLGEGGMGVVYRARHAMLRRPTALKLLPTDKLGERNLARFEKEVQLTASLTHPNTVTIFDYGRTPDGVFYYTMELLDGATLADIVKADGPQPPARIIRVIEQVAGALAEAHGVGLIHRDIKPANIMLAEQGGKPDVAKVLDFGLVKQVESTGDNSLSRADTVVGTPHYMAPETISDPESVDARGDIYALGAVAYFLATGHEVFTGDSVIQICAAHLHDQPVPPSERLGAPLPADLEALILRCLEKDRNDRPQSAGELQGAVQACEAADTWSDDDARAWWRDHGGALHHQRTQGGSGSGLTMDVDLARRAGWS